MVAASDDLIVENDPVIVGIKLLLSFEHEGHGLLQPVGSTGIVFSNPIQKLIEERVLNIFWRLRDVPDGNGNADGRIENLAFLVDTGEQGLAEVEKYF